MPTSSTKALAVVVALVIGLSWAALSQRPTAAPPAAALPVALRPAAPPTGDAPETAPPAAAFRAQLVKGEVASPTDGPAFVSRQSQWLATCRVLDVRPGPTPHRQWRLLQPATDPFLVRAEEELDPATGAILCGTYAVAGRLLVTPTASDPAPLLALAARHGWAVERLSPISTEYLVTAAPSAPVTLDTLPAMLVLLEGEDLDASPDFLAFPQNGTFDATPNDPLLPSTWQFGALRVAQAWTLGTGQGISLVAVLDSGIDLDHPDLSPVLYRNPFEIAGNDLDDDGNGFVDDTIGWDCADNDPLPDDADSHGSHVSGIIAAKSNNGLGMAGIAPNVRIIPLRMGDASFSFTAIYRAMDYVTVLDGQLKASTRPERIVATNNSYGGSGSNSSFQSRITTHRDRGILFVAAAGNDAANNDATPSYPANYTVSNVISVAAASPQGELAGWSNFGAQTVDVAGPGVALLSTVPNGAYAYIGGTSMASPAVAGVYALLRDVCPDLSWTVARDLLLASVVPYDALTGKVQRGGIVDARLLLENALSAAPLPVLAWQRPERGVARIGVGQGTVLQVANARAATSLPWDASQLQWTVSPTSGAELAVVAPGQAVLLAASEGEYLATARSTQYPTLPALEAWVQVGSGPFLSEGLDGWWRFEGNGSDSSGRGRNLAFSGSVTYGQGASGQALDLGNGTGYGSFAYAPASRRSMSAWVRTAGSPSIFPRLFDTPEFILYLGRQFGIPNVQHFDTFSVKFVAERGASDGIWSAPNYSVPDRVWRHVAAVIDHTAQGQQPRIFIDGTEVIVGAQGDSSNPEGTAFIQGPYTAFSGTATIGNRPDGARALAGLLDEMRLYTRLLPAPAVTALALEFADLSAPTTLLTANRDVAYAGAPLTVSLTPLAGSGPAQLYRLPNGGGAPVALLGDGRDTATFSPATTTGGVRLLGWTADATRTRWTATVLTVPDGGPAHASLDTFASAFFGSAASPNAAPTADPDRDGLNNLWELALGLDPTASDAIGTAGSGPRLVGTPSASTVALQWTLATNSAVATAVEVAPAPAGPWRSANVGTDIDLASAPHPTEANRTVWTATLRPTLAASALTVLRLRLSTPQD